MPKKNYTSLSIPGEFDTIAAPQHSALLTPDRAKEAIEIVRPAIIKLLNSGKLSRNVLHIVVLDPAMRHGEVPLREAIIAEASIRRRKWDLDLETLARRKANISWKWQQDSNVLQRVKPYLYGKGDNKYGGAVFYKGIIVSTAGVNWEYDELFAAWIAAACRVTPLTRMEEIMKDTKRHFI